MVRAHDKQVVAFLIAVAMSQAQSKIACDHNDTTIAIIGRRQW